MCFSYYKPQVSKVAEKNITVFKCMFARKNQYVKSPFRHNVYDMRETHTAPNCSLKNEGGFYSFRNLSSAKIWKRNNSRRYGKIFKCTIPKGSKYIEGYQEIYDRNSWNEAKAIRSKQIIFKERVVEND